MRNSGINKSVSQGKKTSLLKLNSNPNVSGNFLIPHPKNKLGLSEHQQLKLVQTLSRWI
jgi:hypothetical protein